MFELRPALDFIIHAFAWTAIGFGLLESTIYFVQLCIATVELRRGSSLRDRSTLWRQSSSVAPPIAVLMPAYNEELSIVESVRSMLALEYPSFEIIVINDGSSDATLERLKEAFGLEPIARAYQVRVDSAPIRGVYGSHSQRRLIVVDKVNGGGKADAMNAGLNLVRAPLFCAVDADSMLEADALLRAVWPYVQDPVHTVAVGGTVRIVNGCTVRGGRVRKVGLPSNWLALFQTSEYLRAFLMGRIAWSRLGLLTLISGAFGIFRHDVVVEAGGFDRTSLGEDLELLVRIHKTLRAKGVDYRVSFVPEPVCWTEVPEDLSTLRKQRVRWQRGALQTFMRHKDMMFRRRYGRVGTLGLGHTLLIDVIGPPVQAIGYILIPVCWALGALSGSFALAFFAVTVGYGIFLNVATLALEEMELRRVASIRDLLKLAFVGVVENLGYRQLNTWWRIVGTWHHLRRREHKWGAMQRVGFKRSS